MATLKTLYRQFEESSNFNKTYTELHRIFQKIPLSLLNECKLDLGGGIFHEYVEKPYTTLYWALGNNVDLSELRP